MACPLPDSVSKCLAQPVYNVGGSDYIALQVCDNNGQLLAVYELCSGVLSGAPTYYDLSGNAYTPSGTPRSCEAGDFEQFVFCDTDTDPPTPFISRVRWDENGDLVPEATGTFALDGLTPFTPVGPITVCGGDVVDAELVGPLCEKDATGNIVGNAWHKIFYRGQAQISTALVGYKLATPSTWLDPYVVGAGNALSICSSGTIDILCKCDDTDADGIGETAYKEVVSISANGTVTVLATYNRTMTAAYTPVSPVDCSVPGDNLIAMSPRYKVLTNASTWVLGADSVIPTSSVSVSVIAVGNIATPPTVTDAGGTYPLFAGQSVSWSTQFDRDVSGLKPPLTFTCTAGSTLAISWQEESV